MKNGKRISIYLSLPIVLGLILLTGCNMIEKLFIDDLMPKREVKKKIVTKRTTSNLKEQKNNSSTNSNDVGEVTKEKYKVILFFSDKEAKGFVQEERRISKVEGLAKATILELIKGPQKTAEALPTIPQGTKLLGIIINQGLCSIDFSRELKDNHRGGSAGEYMTVYSIVKTLRQFSTISKVQILIEGKAVPTLAGHLDISKPLEENLPLN